MILRTPATNSISSGQKLVMIRDLSAPIRQVEDGVIELPVFLVPLLKSIGGFLISSVAGIALYEGYAHVRYSMTDEEQAAEWDRYMRSIYSSEFADTVANRIMLKLRTDESKLSTDQINTVMANAANTQVLRSAQAAIAENINACDRVAIPTAIVSAISEPLDGDHDAAQRLHKLAVSCNMYDPELAVLMDDLASMLEMWGSQRFAAQAIVADLSPAVGSAIPFGDLYNEVINALAQVDPVRLRYIAVAEAITHSNS